LVDVPELSLLTPTQWRTDGIPSSLCVLWVRVGRRVIREVDAFVDECDDNRNIIETHPEVCFTALAGGDASGSKKTHNGTATRIELLQEAVEFDVEAYHQKAVEEFREPSYAPMIGAEDDILDAIVAAFTATLSEDEQESLGREELEGETHDDELGRPIEMRVPGKTVTN
jgi:predicted RNase H-like nuclease